MGCSACWGRMSGCWGLWDLLSACNSPIGSMCVHNYMSYSSNRVYKWQFLVIKPGSVCSLFTLHCAPAGRWLTFERWEDLPRPAQLNDCQSPYDAPLTLWGRDTAPSHSTRKHGLYPRKGSWGCPLVSTCTHVYLDIHTKDSQNQSRSLSSSSFSDG